MANPQPTDAHLRIAHSIIEQIMMRKFSLRHRNILDLILRLSWGCGKKVAIIPRLSDFELVGVGRNHVKTELMWLANVRVINWHPPTNTFEFNKNYDEWLVPPVRKYDPLKLSEVVHLNLVAQVPESGTQFPKQELSSQNGVFPKREPMQQNGNKVPKKEEPSHPSNPDVSTVPSPLNKVFKTSINNNYNTPKIEEVENDDATQTEREILNTLKHTPNFPFDYTKDIEMIRNLVVDFPTVDLLELVKKWSTYILDKPLKKKANPRLQIRNWCSNEVKWGKQGGQRSGRDSTKGNKDGSQTTEGFDSSKFIWTPSA